MARRTLIAGNWKMNQALSDSVELAKAVSAGVSADTASEVVLFPTDLALAAVSEAATDGVDVGVQNVHWEVSGAFTGEVSAELLLLLVPAGS